MRDYCIEMGLYFDEQGKLRRRVARDREVVRVPLDRGSRGRFALVQQGRQTSRGLGSSFMLYSPSVAVESSRGWRISKENRRIKSTW